MRVDRRIPFSDVDVQWVNDSATDLRDYDGDDGPSRGYTVDVLLPMGNKMKMYIDIHSNPYWFNLLDLGEEFMGRLFGMMKERHDTGQIIFYLGPKGAVGNNTWKKFKYNVCDWDNLDFIFRRGIGVDHPMRNVDHHGAHGMSGYIRIELKA